MTIVNRYVYGGNSPATYGDPSGKFIWFIPLILTAAMFMYQASNTPGGFSWSLVEGLFINLAITAVTSGVGGYLGTALQKAAASAFTAVAVGAAAGMGIGALAAGVSGGDVLLGAVLGGITAGLSANSSYAAAAKNAGSNLSASGNVRYFHNNTVDTLEFNESPYAHPRWMQEWLYENGYTDQAPTLAPYEIPFHSGDCIMDENALTPGGEPDMWEKAMGFMRSCVGA